MNSGSLSFSPLFALRSALSAAASTVALMTAGALMVQADEKSRIVPEIPPAGEKMRVIIDSDAGNEIDDLWALALAVTSLDRFEIEGFVSTTYFFDKEASVEKSAVLIEEILEKAGLAGKYPVYRGSHPLQYPKVSTPSEGVDFIVKTAMASTPEDPVWIIALGAATNVASAYLKNPKIADRVRIFWHGRTAWPKKCKNFNVFGDMHAARLLFQSDLPFVLFDTGSELYCPMPESEANVLPHGELGAFIHHYRKNEPEKWMRDEKSFFDLGDIAVLVDPSLGTWETTACPGVDWDLTYQWKEEHGELLRCSEVDRDGTFALLYERLAAAAR